MGQKLSATGPDQALIEHWDGAEWSVAATPGHGSASGMLFSVAAGDGKMWAVGETDDSIKGARPLVETFADGAWRNVSVRHQEG